MNKKLSDPTKVKSAIGNMVDAHPEIAINLLKELIKRPSVNPWFSQDYPGGEKEAQLFLGGYMKERLGAEVRVWEPSADALKEYADGPGYYPDRSFKDRPNVSARVKGSGGGRSMLLFGHMDVVEPAGNWSMGPFDAEIKDGKVYGRGASDMKGGLAAQVAAVEYLKNAGVKLKGDVLIGSVVEEESGGMGTLAYVAEGYRADAAIVGEPTDLTVAPMCRGILWGKIIIKGRNGHIEAPQPHWRDGGAVDAIEKARLYLTHIDALNRDWALRKRHPLTDGPCQVSVAMLNAGDYPTTYASRAEIVIDVQYLPSEKDEHGVGSKVKREIEDFVSRVAQTDEWLRLNPPEIEWMVDADCGEIPADHLFVKTLSENVIKTVQASNGETVVRGVHGHTDMGLLIDNGIATVNFGPGLPSVAHQPDEYLLLEDYLDAVKIIAFTLVDWCEVDF